MATSTLAHPVRITTLALVLALFVGLTPRPAAADASDARETTPAASERAAWARDDDTTASLAHVAAAVEVDWAHRRGLTGAGVGVALIDTGVAPVEGLTDVWHGPDLSLESNVAAAHQLDAYGHGTHLAGIITSDRPDALGMAPDATLLSLKVGAHNGAVDVTQVIAAIDWVVQHRDEANVDVLVLAYGTDGTQDPVHDPLAHAVQTAWRAGITVVVAAGNHGDVRPEVANPATDPYVITVGALDTGGTDRANDDVLADFSAPGTDARRPDLVAPGVGVVANGVPGGYLATTYPAADRGAGLFRGSGTSQAAAVVGAAAALMLQDRPELTPDDVKDLLTASARADHVTDAGAGAGLLNLRAAVQAEPSGIAQQHPVSLGDGTVAAARGSHVLVLDGVALTGEEDIHGREFDSAAWAAAATDGTSWQDGRWNGTAWTGTIGWSGLSWGGLSWGGLSWGGLSWGGLSWGGLSWGGLSWGGLSWGGGDWSGLSWGGLSWGGLSWGGLSWGGLSWGGLSWGGSTWSSLRWA